MTTNSLPSLASFQQIRSTFFDSQRQRRVPVDCDDN